MVSVLRCTRLRRHRRLKLARSSLRVGDKEIDLALLTVPTDEEATPEQAVVFKHGKKLLGRCANAVRVASHSPKLAQSIFGFIVAALREEVTEVLPVRTKVLVILKTSTLNACRY
jgi:hypothetical protein